MKKYILTSAVVIAITALILSGKKIPMIFPPDPSIVVAQDESKIAIQNIIDMKYSLAAAILQKNHDKLPGDFTLRRWYGRALMHLGEWEEAARFFAIASYDSTIRGAVDADMERLRFLDKDGSHLASNLGLWERLKVNYAGGIGVESVESIGAGAIATAIPSRGSVAFWSPSGKKISEFFGMGRPSALAAHEGKVWAADMAGERVIRLSPDRGIEISLELSKLNVHGARGLDIDDDGFLWVIDFGGRRVIRIKQDGTLVSEIGRDVLRAPSAVLCIGKEILIAETELGKVLRFDRNGRLLREYTNPKLQAPVGLEKISDGFLVQDKNGRVYILYNEENGFLTQIRTKDVPLITSKYGIAIDEHENLWWGDGINLNTSRRVPADKPMHIVNILRTEAKRGLVEEGRINLLVSILDENGRALDKLDDEAFRVIYKKEQIFPIRIENLSQTLSGRRYALLIEASDAMLPLYDSIKKFVEPFISNLRAEDKTMVIEIRDTFSIARDFTYSSQLIEEAVSRDFNRVSAIDVKPAEALAFAIETLAPTDYGRAIVWLTSGAGIDDSAVLKLGRMSIVNQTPIIILHIGDENRMLLEILAKKSNGGYFRLFDSNYREISKLLSEIKSGRYRITAPLTLPEPSDRGKWFDVTCEVRYYTETAFDKLGYFAF